MDFPTGPAPSHAIPTARLARIRAREEARFAETHPKARALHDRALAVMPHGVPMHWMGQWGTPFPIHAESADKARLTDVDGHTYVDFNLGDSAAFFGHANPVIAQTVAREVTGRGTSFMLPTEDAIAMSENLGARFGLPLWQVATSATEANRYALRIARMLTGRAKVLVFNGKFHGSVDDTQVELEQGRMVVHQGVIANGLDLDRTTVAVEFNDIPALERALAAGDVAAVLTEPHMTNIGMIPAAPGFHDALRRLTRKTGTLLIVDETHTICMGPRGGTGELGLEPDMLVLGKVLAGGIPSAVYGMTEAVGRALEALTPGSSINHYGFGGTLAANALSIRTIRRTLEEVATEENFAAMIAVATALEQAIARQIAAHDLPWHVSRMGARVEYLYRPDVPVNGSEARAARHDDIEQLSHLYFANRGVLVSPFHNMALISPFTTLEDVARYEAVFAEMLGEYTARAASSAA